MKSYRTHIRPFPGTNYSEILRKAHAMYKIIASKSKRNPYVRSAYFKKEKVFLDYFWQHLQDKNWRDRVRRVRLYPCALDAIQHSKGCSEVRMNPNKKEKLYKFEGITKDGDEFIVQIKQDLKRNEKYFLSVFPK